MLREGARPAGGRGGAPCRRGGRRACPFKSPAATTVRAKAGGERVRGDRGGGEGAQSPPPRWGRAGREAGRDHCPERGVRGGPVAGVSRGRYHSRGGARATGGTIALRGLRDAAGGGSGREGLRWAVPRVRRGGGGGAGGQWSLCVFAGGGRTRRRRGETPRRPLPPGAEPGRGPRPSPSGRR